MKELDARVQIKEFADKIKTDPELSKLLDEIWKGNHVLTMCLDCGKVFVNMPTKEFILKDSCNTMANPGKWFLDAEIHWCENPKHRIIGYKTGEPAYNFTNAWIVALQRFNFPRERLLKEARKLREKAESKPI